ncbi:helix-turn-helix transcriptional regulator [Dyadobacter aurulentus]|uniref:helix-turn-helix transcriptional regulator n=1 Tax=Dyadobacter sp. UC 10 TaxID=2605428 RepID=UPI001CED1660|nr:helix-turn-helix transcriptional regulator [Dyadobacter sp. UC 10]
MSIQKMKEKIIGEAVADNEWQKAAEFREANAAWLDISFRIGLAILRILRERKMSQKDLAKAMSCSPQYINKIVKGSENLTLETICKLEKIMDSKLIEVSARNTNYTT